MKSIISQDQKKAETRANIKMLNDRRDKVITIKDIDDAFEIMREEAKQSDYGWYETHHFIYKTIKDLYERGCDVSKLAIHFRKKSKELFKEI